VLLDSWWYAGRLVDEALELARERRARAFWVVMHGAGVPFAQRLLRQTDLPVHLTVHDDPAYGMTLLSRKSFFLAPLVERQFAAALRAATSVDTIGEPMAERYRRRYGVESVVIHRAVAGPVTPRSRFDPARKELSVGVFGSNYSYASLPVLGRSVGRAARRLGVRPKILVVGHGHGERLRRDVGAEVEVAATGHLDEPAAIDRLSECLILYLNYPFPARYRVLRETSFPVKLSTLLQTTRPILAHAPSGTTLEALRPYAGYVRFWNDLDEESGAGHLAAAWSDAASAGAYTADAESVRERFYDRDRNRGRLAEVLNRLVAGATPARC
jgi:hypothetical protein